MGSAINDLHLQSWSNTESAKHDFTHTPLDSPVLLGLAPWPLLEKSLARLASCHTNCQKVVTASMLLEWAGAIYLQKYGGAGYGTCNCDKEKEAMAGEQADNEIGSRDTRDCEQTLESVKELGFANTLTPLDSAYSSTFVDSDDSSGSVDSGGSVDSSDSSIFIISKNLKDFNVSFESLDIDSSESLKSLDSSESLFTLGSLISFTTFGSSTSSESLKPTKSFESFECLKGSEDPKSLQSADNFGNKSESRLVTILEASPKVEHTLSTHQKQWVRETQADYLSEFNDEFDLLGLSPGKGINKPLNDTNLTSTKPFQLFPNQVLDAEISQTDYHSCTLCYKIPEFTIEMVVEFAQMNHINLTSE